MPGARSVAVEQGAGGATNPTFGANPSRERESGVYLSILGFGGGNYNDLLMQKLAQSGNGMAAYIDTLNEGRKVLNDDLSGSMFSIADDQAENVTLRVTPNNGRAVVQRITFA